MAPFCLLLNFILSCQGPKVETFDFNFATYENKPIFIDENQFQKESKKGLKIEFESSEWYLIDWNGNGLFNELGIDYFGVKSPFSSKPILSILEKENKLNHNGQTYPNSQKTDFKKLTKSKFLEKNTISYISNFIPLELTDGKIITSDILEKFDTTVVYFWASWCPPCVDKLVELEAHKEELQKKNIQFIPLYYGSSLSSVMEVIAKRKLSVIPLEASEKIAENFQITGLPVTYVFDKSGKLTAKKFEF